MKEEIHRWLSLLEVWDLQRDRSAPMAQNMAAAQILTALHPQAQANAGERPHLPVLLPAQHAVYMRRPVLGADEERAGAAEHELFLVPPPARMAM